MKKVIKEIFHVLFLLLIVTVLGYLVYYDEWTIISRYKDVVVLGFILIIEVEIVFNSGKKHDLEEIK